VGNILKRHGIAPAPERKKTTTWKEFIRTHLDMLVATDFFTAEVWTMAGLVTYYVLFFIHVSFAQGLLLDGSKDSDCTYILGHEWQWNRHEQTPGGSRCVPCMCQQIW
jgi:hypothetical protein